MKNNSLRIGDALPEFKNLPGVDDRTYSSGDFRNDALIIVFSCNHCPYVQAYEDRMKALHASYQTKNVQLVAINSNDETNYPDDSFEKMKERAAMRDFTFPYLRDSDQRVAEQFGATHTPQFFLFDKEKRLRYSGKMDDNWKEPDAVKEKYLVVALDAVLAGKEVKVPETFSIGCTIKWK
ncbi:MAG TPA: thioredoxin family protein [Bacteroidota bacterium]|nr:thioredoxin family protein [Bacteroidota bacterium]